MKALGRVVAQGAVVGLGVVLVIVLLGARKEPAVVAGRPGSPTTVAGARPTGPAGPPATAEGPTEDAELAACGPDPASSVVVVSGTVRNPGPRDASYRLDIDVVAGERSVERVTVATDPVAPGAESGWSARGSVPIRGDVACTLVGAERSEPG
jgi:hypothetical protein